MVNLCIHVAEEMLCLNAMLDRYTYNTITKSYVYVQWRTQKLLEAGANVTRHRFFFWDKLLYTIM